MSYLVGVILALVIGAGTTWAGYLAFLLVTDRIAPASAVITPPMTSRTSAVAVVVMLTLGPVAQAAADPDGAGETSLDLRYRYEYVDDDAATFAAQASTVRAALGYQTRSFHGLRAVGQLAAVGTLGPDFYRVPMSPTQDNMAYPTVPDPAGVMVDQAHVRFDASWLTLKLGRQELAFNDTRFVGPGPWRQVRQTFDAASVVVRPVDGVSVQYALTGRVNRMTGRDARDGQQLLLGDLVNARYERRGRGSLAVYDLHLDYLMDSTSSTNTVGARVEGPLQLDADWSLLYAAELARQTDAGTNPNPFAAGYYLAEAGAAFRGFSARVQYNVREGDGALDKLSTPLSHAWDGWSEKFEITPDAGLRTMSVSLAGPVPRVRGLSVSAAYHEYWSQSTKAHYGREQDLGVEYRLGRVDPRWTAGSRVSFYDADQLHADTLRMSVYTAYGF